VQTTTSVLGPFTVGPQAGPAGVFDILRVAVSFTLTPGDSASLSGRFEVGPGAA
jgi:hypothetical protein